MQKNVLLMLLTMRHKSKKRIVVFWFLCSVIFFIILASFYSIRLYEKKKTFVSPIPKYNAEAQTEQINMLSALLKEKNFVFSGVFPFDIESYIVKLMSGEEIFFSRNKPFEDQVSSLQLVLSRLTIEGKRVSRIDFRFNTPVLTMQ